MSEHGFQAEGISATLDLAVGHIADFAITSGARTLKPLHRAPWIDRDDLPEGLPEGVVRLSGDFLCAPFSRSDVEAAPLHGWPANSAWDLVADEAISGGRRTSFRLQHKVMGATVDKTLVLRDGHPFLYQEHSFTGGSGAISVAHHPMTEMAAGGRLAFSPKRLAATPPDVTEPNPARGAHLLAYPARSADLTRFPAANGGQTDLTDYSAVRRHEDFVTLVEADHGGMGWTAVARNAEADVVLVLKNPAELPVTMLWISNGGRYYAPWNGRHGVLGIEDGRSAIGHAASIGDNWLKQEGIETAFALGGRVAFRQIVGAMPLDGGDPPSQVEALPGRLRLIFADGSQREAPFDETFLRIDQPILK
ncbi:hypothetical protein [Aminobacter aminovorans]|uniref:hypothetical protein n=1 Tax=Aminobacter aminovorans TaxID=83263 RepID=UPI00285B1148|nr:hypothetical protein [Aminobacter aminovorans]MDR7221248.1 hypothetical protein [Aminobacter aminovorans]